MWAMTCPTIVENEDNDNAYTVEPEKISQIGTV
jgi:hypothetical protein